MGVDSVPDDPTQEETLPTHLPDDFSPGVVSEVPSSSTASSATASLTLLDQRILELQFLGNRGMGE